MKLFRQLFLFLIVFSFLGFISPISAEEAKPAPEATPAEAPDADLLTPRKTIQTFFEGVAQVREGNVDGYDSILKTLDLSPIPSVVRNAEGRDIAIELLATMNRVKAINYSEIPNYEDGDPWVLYSSPTGDIVIVKVNGNWKFSGATITDATDIYRTVEDQPLLEGLGEHQQDLSNTKLDIRKYIPASLKKKTFLIEDWQWIAIVSFFTAAYLFKLLVLLVLRFIAARIEKRASHLQYSKNFRSAANPAAYSILFLLLSQAVDVIGFRLLVESYLKLALSLALTFSILLVIYRLIDVASEMMLHKAKGTGTQVDDLLIPLIQRVGKVLLVVFGLLAVLRVFEVDITGLIAGLGLGGLAFALAAKDTVENIFGSITVLLDRPFQIGDFVIVDSIEGTVESIGLRSTKIRTPTNSLVSMPNSTLIKTHVDNLGARHYRRTRILLGVTYDTPSNVMEAFRDGILKLIAEHPKTRKDYYQVHFYDFGPSSLDILVNVFFTVADYAGELEAREELFLNILQLAEGLGISFAFPSQSLYVEGTPDRPFSGMQKPANAEEFKAKAKEIAANLAKSESN